MKSKPDYVTREARKAVERLQVTRAVDVGEYMTELERAMIQFARRVLRRAARECDGVAIDHRACANLIAAFKDKTSSADAEVRRSMARVATECRDAIRALATGGRG